MLGRRRSRGGSEIGRILGRLPKDGAIEEATLLLRRVRGASLEAPISLLALVPTGPGTARRLADELLAAAERESVSVGIVSDDANGDLELGLMLLEGAEGAEQADAALVAGTEDDLKGRDGRHALRTLERAGVRVLGAVVLDARPVPSERQGPQIDLAGELERAGLPELAPQLPPAPEPESSKPPAPVPAPAVPAPTQLVPPAQPQAAAPDELLRARIEAVTKREVAMARRAASLAAQERRLAEQDEAAAQRAEELERLERELSERAAAPPPAPEPVEVAPATAPLPAVPAPATPVAPFDPPSYDVSRLERLVAEHPDPVQRSEWQYYLLYLREFITPQGLLPREFEPLINDVFGDLLDQQPERAGV